MTEGDALFHDLGVLVYRGGIMDGFNAALIMVANACPRVAKESIDINQIAAVFDRGVTGPARRTDRRLGARGNKDRPSKR